MKLSAAVTVSLVPEARGGPFMFWDDLPGACREAARLGFDGVEIFAPSADSLDEKLLRQTLADFGLRLAALGTGAGWLLHHLSLSASDEQNRNKAVSFVKRIIDLGGSFGAPAIVGSMQGRAQESKGIPAARARLATSLRALSDHAMQYRIPLLYEPLNRYETNICNSLADATRLIDSTESDNVRVLADLFHMNIEETGVADALREAGAHVGHVHLVDSNRRPAGLGHLEFQPIAEVLSDINFEGWLSAEALPFPDSLTAAQRTIDAFRQYFGRSAQ